MEVRSSTGTTSDPIRVVLVDDQVLLRTSLSRVFASEPDFELAGEYATGSEAMEMLQNGEADVVVLNFDTFLSGALNRYRGKMLVLAGAARAGEYAHALKQGAKGIFLRSESAVRLVQAIRAVARGEVWIDPEVIRLLAERLSDEVEREAPMLSERERKVLDGIVAGFSNRKIGESMGLSEGSVKAVVQQLFEKTGVRTRSQLVRKALENVFPACA